MLYHLISILLIIVMKVFVVQLRLCLLSALCVPAFTTTAALAMQTDKEAEIIVQASALGLSANSSATPVISLSGAEFVHRRQATLGETLNGQAGIHFDNFGGGASRPVIRGQTSPRVQALSDGAGIYDASAISPDHMVVTEPVLLKGVEVLRGPATLIYGGGAIGGAINLLDEKVPTAIPEGGITGAIEARAATADDERTIAGGITFGTGPFAFRLEGVDRNSNDYQVPKRYGAPRVANSFNDTNTFSIGGSWVGDDGYVGVAYTRQRSHYGLPGHSHDHGACHPHGTTLHCHDDDNGHEHGHGHGHGEDDHPAPFVKLRSERFDIRSDYNNPIAGLEKVRLRMSFTHYAHDEIEGHTVITKFKNSANDLRFEANHSPIGALRGVVGVQHLNSRFSATGLEAYLPENNTKNTAVFVMESLELGKLRLELAARHEWQSIATPNHNTKSHRPFSVSGAAVWEALPGYSIALALARSQRAPNAQELFADGVHLATNTYELGSPGLKQETSRSVDLTLRKTTGATTLTIGAYHQNFLHYIYADTLDQHEDFRLIKYSSADVHFTGVDGDIRHQITPELGVSAFGDYVRAKFKHEHGNLPRIPSARLGTRIDAAAGPLSADIEFYHMFSQKRIAAYESRTKGYEMLNATLAYQMNMPGRATAELFLRGSNLTNALAYNHASFIKEASPLKGRSLVIGIRAGL